MTGSWKGRGNQFIQFVRVLYCELPTNGKQLLAFPLEAMPGTETWPHEVGARVLPLCHCGPSYNIDKSMAITNINPVTHHKKTPGADFTKGLKLSPLIG